MLQASIRVGILTLFSFLLLGHSGSNYFLNKDKAVVDYGFIDAPKPSRSHTNNIQAKDINGSHNNNAPPPSTNYSRTGN